MCHLIATTTLKNATFRRVDRSDWGWVTGLVPDSVVRQVMPRFAPYLCRNPDYSWLFARSAPKLLHARGNLTL